ncbi:MAG TPA: hypothetical protein DCE71_00690, partial [Parachlamydiales bacterium]|nr:hypothetical protein [Parachlamydiales bacterium]
MSHQIPAIPSPSGPSHLIVTTNSGSVTVSGVFSLLGVSPINTFVSGTSVYISGTGGSSGLTIQADSGTASPNSGILKIVTPSIVGQYIQTIGTGNTLTVQGSMVGVLFGGTGNNTLTANGLLYGQGTSPVGVTNPGNNGQVLISGLGNPPKFAYITSSSGSITFTPGPNSLNIEAVSNSNSLTIQGNQGTAFPVANVLSILGNSPIMTVGSGSAGLTILFDFNSTFFNPLAVGYGGTGQTILTQYGVLIGEGSNSVNVTGPGTDGQMLLGATGADP